MNFFAVLVEQAIDPLFVARGAERDGDEGLRFATLEHGRAVHAGEHIDFAIDLPQRVVLIATVGRVPAMIKSRTTCFDQIMPGDREHVPA